MKDLVSATLIKSNERFDSFSAIYKGQKVFAKYAKNQKSSQLLQKQAASALFIDKIGAHHGLRAPKTIVCEKGWLMMEWLEGESIGRLAVDDPEYAAKILAKYFELFDKQPSSANQLRDVFTVSGLNKRLKERLLPKKYIDKSRVDDAVARYIEFRGMLRPSWQDGDIKPDHLYPETNDRFVLIDSEHLGSDWPRFYDPANNIAKYWVRGNIAYCRAIMQATIRRITIRKEEFERTLSAILIIRGLAMLWAKDYESGLPSYGIDQVYDLLEAACGSKPLEHLGLWRPHA